MVTYNQNYLNVSKVPYLKQIMPPTKKQYILSCSSGDYIWLDEIMALGLFEEDDDDCTNGKYTYVAYLIMSDYGKPRLVEYQNDDLYITIIDAEELPEKREDIEKVLREKFKAKIEIKG